MYEGRARRPAGWISQPLASEPSSTYTAMASLSVVKKCDLPFTFPTRA